MPPLGCAPDAVKLFVGNVPRSATEQQLLPLFSSLGTVRCRCHVLAVSSGHLGDIA